MKWNIYPVAPIDMNWEFLETVESTKQKLLSEEVPGERRPKRRPDHAEFSNMWIDAQQAAKQAGWDGDERREPVVLWLPKGDGFACGFVIKQERNGQTFVVSPFEMAWLRMQVVEGEVLESVLESVQ